MKPRLSTLEPGFPGCQAAFCSLSSLPGQGYGSSNLTAHTLKHPAVSQVVLELRLSPLSVKWG